MVLEWACVEGGFTAATGPGSAGVLGQHHEGHRPEGGVSLDDALVLLPLQHLESSSPFPEKLQKELFVLGHICLDFKVHSFF